MSKILFRLKKRQIACLTVIVVMVGALLVNAIMTASVLLTVVTPPQTPLTETPPAQQEIEAALRLLSEKTILIDNPR